MKGVYLDDNTEKLILIIKYILTHENFWKEIIALKDDKKLSDIEFGKQAENTFTETFKEVYIPNVGLVKFEYFKESKDRYNTLWDRKIGDVFISCKEAGITLNVDLKFSTYNQLYATINSDSLHDFYGNYLCFNGVGSSALLIFATYFKGAERAGKLVAKNKCYRNIDYECLIEPGIEQGYIIKVNR